MLTYSTWLQSLYTDLVISSNDANFPNEITNIIDYAEQRIYRELDLLNTVVYDSSAAFTTGTRKFNLPSSISTFVVVNQIYAITPSGQTNPDLGTRNPLQPTSREDLDARFPSSLGSAVPAWFAMATQTSIIVGPWPDQAYQVEVAGTIRPTALSSTGVSTTNATTLLTVYFPDLFLAASLIKGFAYLQNFGASGAIDNPGAGDNWESQYQNLLKGAQLEEARKKFTSEGWSSKQPAPLATPPRT